MGSHCTKCLGADDKTRPTSATTSVIPAPTATLASVQRTPRHGNGRASPQADCCVPQRLPVLSTNPIVVITTATTTTAAATAVSNTAHAPPVSYKTLFKTTVERVRATKARRRTAERAGPLGPVQFMCSDAETASTSSASRSYLPRSESKAIDSVQRVQVPATAAAITTAALPCETSERTLQLSSESRTRDSSSGGGDIGHTQDCTVIDDPLCTATRHRGSRTSAESDAPRSPHGVEGETHSLPQMLIPRNTLTVSDRSVHLEESGSSCDDDTLHSHPLDADQPDGPDAFA